MSVNRRRSRPIGVAKHLDRRARLFGLAYLLVAACVAVLHDEVLSQPTGRLGHHVEQIILGAMVVFGLLGGLLLVEGRRLLEGARTSPDRRRTASGHIVVAGPLHPAGDQWDTRYGVAMILGAQAIEAARQRRATPDEVAPSGTRPVVDHQQRG